MSLARPRVRIPASARAGEVIEIRTLIEHPMDTGLRHDGGRTAPRNMLRNLVVTMNGLPVFEAEFRNATSTNPYHVFFVRMQASAEFVFTWTDEAGNTARSLHRVAVG